jgi:asparagine synthase (glutamine-hydrolysing)
MFSSIEARAPYLDVDLATYAASIPPSTKYRNGKKKAILKAALKQVLPDFVINKAKSGFNAPVHDWISSEHSNEFKDYNLYIYKTFVNAHIG